MRQFGASSVMGGLTVGASGGIYPEWGLAITALSDDSIVETGHFTFDTIFGEGEPNETILVSSGAWDIFLAKFNQ
jgi:hypothetical protein